MKLGILGGTFNPVHIAHIYIAQAYREKLGLDKIILIPTYIPPHKSVKSLVSAEQRLEMCRLAIKNYPHFDVCDYEIIDRNKSYTCRTLRYLRTVYPDAEFYLIMGSDMFMTVQDWRHPQEIYENATLCAAEREEGDIFMLESHAIRLRNEGARCMILDIKPLQLSSTTVRKGIQSGEDVSGLLDPRVWEYIRRNGLYGV